MPKALAEGETNPAALSALADERLRATPEQLCDVLGACTELNAVFGAVARVIDRPNSDVLCLHGTLIPTCHDSIP